MGLRRNNAAGAIVGTFLLAALMFFSFQGFALAGQQSGTKIDVDAESRACIECHTKKDIAVNLIDQWKQSKHAQEGIGCNECHAAEKGEFDAFTCPESSMIVGQHPTPKDCEACHPDPVKQHRESKHGLGQNFFAIRGADRTGVTSS